MCVNAGTHVWVQGRSCGVWCVWWEIQSTIALYLWQCRRVVALYKQCWRPLYIYSIGVLRAQINDGFHGGNSITRNGLWNSCRESGDHGEHARMHTCINRASMLYIIAVIFLSSPYRLYHKHPPCRCHQHLGPHAVHNHDRRQTFNHASLHQREPQPLHLQLQQLWWHRQRRR